MSPRATRVPSVLHLIRDLRYGGDSTQLRLVAAAAAARGERVVVASLRRPGPAGAELAAAGATVEWARWRMGVDPFAAVGLRSLAERAGAEVVQTWDAASERAVRWSGLARRRAWVATVRDAVTRPRRGLAAAAAVLATHDTAESAAYAAGARGGRVFRAENAVDPAIVAAAADRAAARDALRRAGADLPDGAPVIAAVCRIDHAEQAKQLAWAVDLVRVVRPGVRLLVAGEGPGLTAAQRFAAAAIEPGTACWLGAWPDLAGLYAAADVVWCGGQGGAASTPALEARAAARPIVVACGRIVAAGHASDAVEPIGCLTVPLHDRAGWARATLKLLDTAPAPAPLGPANEPSSVSQQHADAQRRAAEAS